MALDKQVYIYSVDTSAFYTSRERILRKLIHIAKQNEEKVKASELERSFRNVIDSNTRLKRTLDPKYLNVNNKVSLFESSLTRTLGLDTGQTVTDIIIVETHFYSIFDSLIENGFDLMGEEYVPFTASAGQIRMKKTVFMKKSLWEKYKLTLMCGLTENSISSHYDKDKNNRRSYGVSINKYLAYLALCGSATDPWSGFNIDRSIVVDDFETTINTEVDFVDDESYKITRKHMDVPIAHTDGCGMILPRKSKKAFMTRLPWVKGLLIPFPFDDFVKENDSPKVKDIYGKEYDILKDKIEVIFTKSQFKMYKYYNSWDEYKGYFKQYKCQANVTNIEEDEISGSRLNYQMLQTLTDITDEELKALASATKQRLQATVSNPDDMLKLLGALDGDFKKKNHLQQALNIYPELLIDSHTRAKIKEAKGSLVRKAYTGKLDVSGCYTFVAPDLYAFCEWLFKKIENPVGLLNNGEVSCSSIPNGDKVDCLRSPHLYREHAIRTNKLSKETSKWFITKSVHTSIHDPISKILQFDCDGDKITVSNDNILVKVAERNMNGIVPLYYDMKKAAPEKITAKNISKNLKRAFSGNIGIISNDITKIWNNEDIDIDLIKLRTMENNFEIDAAKTNYKPVRPIHIKKMFKPYNKMKMPYFFKYEKYRSKPDDRKKKKKKATTEPWDNTTTVNKLKEIFPDVRIRFKAVKDRYHFDYRMLMKEQPSGGNLDKEIIKKYNELNDAKWKYNPKKKKDDDISTSDILPLYNYIREEILKIHSNVYYVTDVLVDYLFTKMETEYKTTLWSSFGDIIVENLKSNLNDRIKLCQKCSTVIDNTKSSANNSKKYCVDCFKEIRKEQVRKNVRNLRNKNK